jgi:regulator of cell morphogenesis and NO signaling
MGNIAAANSTSTPTESPTLVDELSADLPLSRLALRAPAYAAVLDRHRLDFCCRGGRTLAQACAASGLDATTVLAELRAQGAARSTAPTSDSNWNERPLGEVIDFIVDTHHAYTRDAIGHITPLLAKVVARHEDIRAKLTRLSLAFAELAAELGPHLMREERVLFPYVRALAGPEGAPPPPFGTVRNPVRMMMREHDRVAELLAQIADASDGFVVPAGACVSYRALYAALAELRLDLLAHLSIENNVLFPRALILEDRQTRPLPSSDPLPKGSPAVSS